MKKKLMALLLAVAVVGMYSFGSVASVFAEEGTENSTTTISATNVTWEKVKDKSGYDVYHGAAEFVIPAGTEGKVNLDYRDALNKFFMQHFENKYGVETNHGYSMPGDWYKLDINVVNESGKEYKYVDNSFVLSGYSDDLSADNNTKLFGNLITWGYSDDMNINNILGTKIDNTANVTYAVNNYAADGIAYSGANTFFESALDVKAVETSSTINTQLFIDGPNTGNVYAGADIDFTSILTLEPVAEKTTYSVITNYYTSTDGSKATLDGTETRMKDVETSVGSELSITAEDGWLTFNDNKYDDLSDSEKTVTKTAALNPKDNEIIFNYYRNVNSPSIPDPTPGVKSTSYTVVGNYFTSNNGGVYTQDNSTAVTLKTGTANVGDTITQYPQDSWATYNGNIYTYDESKSTITKVVVLDPLSNVLTINYYRVVTNGNGGDNPSNNNTDNNNDNGGGKDTPSNNNSNGGGSSTGTAVNVNSTVPDTGDTSDAVLWTSLGLTGMVLAGVMISLRRKEEK